MEEIKRDELIEFLKKISENTLTKELEIEVPLGLPPNVVGIHPKIVKVDVKWLIGQVLSKFENPTVPETKNNEIAICVKEFFDFFSDERPTVTMTYSKLTQVGDKFIIGDKDDNNVCLYDPDTKITYKFPAAFYYEHFKEFKGGM